MRPKALCLIKQKLCTFSKNQNVNCAYAYPTDCLDTAPIFENEIVIFLGNEYDLSVWYSI
jgi:hypothetical protein